MAARLDHVQVAIPVGGEDDARAFYGDLIGLAEIPKPEAAGRGGCWFAIGEAQIHIGADPDFRAAKKAHVAIVVDDLAAMRGALTAAGHVAVPGTVVRGRERFFTEDRHGNRVEVIGAA